MNAAYAGCVVFGVLFRTKLRGAVQQRRPACELSHFPDDPAGALGEESPAAAGFVVPGEVDMASQDHEQAVARFADLEKRLARGIVADLAKSTHPLHLRRLHGEEELRQGYVGEVFVHLAQSIAQDHYDVTQCTGVALQ